MRIDVHTHLIYLDFIKHMTGRSSLPNGALDGANYIVHCTTNFDLPVEPLYYTIEDKLRDMDRMSADVSLLTHGIPGPEFLPPDEADDWASRINDYIASIVEQYPGKFIGCGSIGFGDPQRSIAEVDRCVNELGFKGFQLFSNTNQKVLDSPEFIPVYRRIAQLGVPLNMHPTAPLNMVGMAGTPLVPGMGFLYDTSLGTMRLIASGLFDQEPDLNLIVPHVGGILPYLRGRCGRAVDNGVALGQYSLQNSAQYYLDRIYVDTVAHSLDALEFCYQHTSAERILYGTDHPFANYIGVSDLVEQLRCTAAEREMIYHGNAERLLKLN